MLLVGISLHFSRGFVGFRTFQAWAWSRKRGGTSSHQCHGRRFPVDQRSHCLHLGGVVINPKGFTPTIYKDSVYFWTLALLGFPNRRDEDGMVKPVQNWEVVMILQGNTWYKSFSHYQWENIRTSFFQKSFPIELKILIMVYNGSIYQLF